LTSKRIIRNKMGTPTIQLPKIEEALKEDDNIESDNEGMRKKSAKKGKEKLTKVKVALYML